MLAQKPKVSCLVYFFLSMVFISKNNYDPQDQVNETISDGKYK